MIRFFWISLITLVAFTTGLGASYLMEDPSSIIVFPLEATVFAITVTAFSFSLLFFGFSSPIVMFFVGAFVSHLFKTAAAPHMTIGILAIASLVAAMAAVRLGDSLLDDMRGKGNFKESLKVTLPMMGLSLVLSLAVDLVVTV
jgi:hypothetical protein